MTGACYYEGDNPAVSGGLVTVMIWYAGDQTNIYVVTKPKPQDDVEFKQIFDGIICSDFREIDLFQDEGGCWADGNGRCRVTECRTV